MKANKGFTNRAKSGDKALAARWRQQSAKGKLDKSRKPRNKRGAVRKKG